MEDDSDDHDDHDDYENFLSLHVAYGDEFANKLRNTFFYLFHLSLSQSRRIFHFRSFARSRVCSFLVYFRWFYGGFLFQMIIADKHKPADV